jgi:hypothetical protein
VPAGSCTTSGNAVSTYKVPSVPRIASVAVLSAGKKWFHQIQWGRGPFILEGHDPFPSVHDLIVSAWWQQALRPCELLLPWNRLRKTQNQKAGSIIATGRVRIHARAILRTVSSRRPERLAVIVPATPDESRWVVLTGSP